MTDSTPRELPCPFCEGKAMSPDCGICGGAGTLPDATPVVRAALDHGTRLPTAGGLFAPDVWEMVDGEPRLLYAAGTPEAATWYATTDPHESQIDEVEATQPEPLDVHGDGLEAARREGFSAGVESANDGLALHAAGPGHHYNLDDCRAALQGDDR